MKSISALVCLVASIAPSFAQVNLATAATFGVLAVEGITSSGASVVNGSVGTTGRTVIGFPPGVATGTIAAPGSASVVQARADSLAAFTAAQAMTSDTTLTAIAGNGQILEAGVYKFSRTATLEGTLTLNGTGTFVFQVAAQLITEPGSEMILAGGAVASDVFWAVGNTANLAAATTFVGNLMTDNTITLGAGTTVVGGLYGAESVSLNDNIVGL